MIRLHGRGWVLQPSRQQLHLAGRAVVVINDSRERASVVVQAVRYRAPQHPPPADLPSGAPDNARGRRGS